MNRYKVREVIKMLEADGWVKQKGKGGDHRQYKHPTKPGKVTVVHPEKDMSKNMLKNIEKQAGIKFPQ